MKNKKKTHSRHIFVSVMNENHKRKRKQTLSFPNCKVTPKKKQFHAFYLCLTELGVINIIIKSLPFLVN